MIRRGVLELSSFPAEKKKKEKKKKKKKRTGKTIKAFRLPGEMP